MIPEAAVEAAAAGIFRHMEDAPWESAGPEEIPFFIASARLALEAAAPHMLEQAWNEGYEKGDHNARHADIGLQDSDFNNPYGNTL